MKADTAILKRVSVKRIRMTAMTVPSTMKTQQLMMKVNNIITDETNTCMHAKHKQFLNSNVLMDSCKVSYRVCVLHMKKKLVVRGGGKQIWMCTTKLKMPVHLFSYLCTECENCSAPAEFHSEECGNSYCGECLKWRHSGKRKISPEDHQTRP